MELSMRQKFRRIASWVKKLYVDKAFPFHKLTGPIIDAFYQLAEFSKAVDEDFSVLIEDIMESGTEYEEKAKSLQSTVSEKQGISLSHLSSEALANIDVLVECAIALDTKDTSFRSLFGAINDLTSKIYEAECKNNEIKKEIGDIKTKIFLARLLEDSLEEDRRKSKRKMRFDQSELKRRMKNYNFLRKKTLDMRIRSINGEMKLDALGMNLSLTHEALVDLSQKLSKDQKVLKKLKTRVRCYKDLLPSFTLATVKIEEAKQELSSVEEELTEEVNEIFYTEV